MCDIDGKVIEDVQECRFEYAILVEPAGRRCHDKVGRELDFPDACELRGGVGVFTRVSRRAQALYASASRRDLRRAM